MTKVRPVPSLCDCVSVALYFLWKLVVKRIYSKPIPVQQRKKASLTELWWLWGHYNISERAVCPCRRQKRGKPRESVSVFKSMNVCLLCLLSTTLCKDGPISLQTCDFLCRNGYARKPLAPPNLHTVLSGNNSLPALLSNSNSQSFLVHHADETVTTAQRVCRGLRNCWRKYSLNHTNVYIHANFDF